MSLAIHHDVDDSRFEYTQNNQVCHLDYELHDDIMAITHTYVPSALEGQGIAAALTKAALLCARNNQWRVRPICSYTATYLQRHPEFQDLIVR